MSPSRLLHPSQQGILYVPYLTRTPLGSVKVSLCSPQCLCNQFGITCSSLKFFPRGEPQTKQLPFLQISSLNLSNGRKMLRPVRSEAVPSGATMTARIARSKFFKSTYSPLRLHFPVRNRNPHSYFPVKSVDRQTTIITPVGFAMMLQMRLDAASTVGVKARILVLCRVHGRTGSGHGPLAAVR